MRFGAHMSTAGGIWKALERGHQISCESVQVFVKNNMQWFGRPYLPNDIAQFKSHRARGNFAHVFGHAGYLINLAAAPSENRDKSIKSMVQEIQLATEIELPFLVLHPGAHLGAGEDAGLKQVIAALNEVCRLTKESSVRVALENTAGQGSCLGCALHHLAVIYNGVDHPERLAVCLDTAHFYAAGFDIRTECGWNNALDKLDGLVGLEQVVAFHLNDSKTDLGSRVDRHAHIGQGKIGLDAFRHIVNDPRFQNHPACLETPKSDDLHEDVENLRVLRSLLTSAIPEPAKPAVRTRSKKAGKSRRRAA
jgi:deoxyribonuclease-4